MKRTISLLALFAMVLVVASCGNRPKKAAVETGKALVELDKAAFQSRIANYEESPQEWKYLGDKPAMVMFTADWCHFCKVLEPVLSGLAKDYDGEIYFYKVDVDKETELAGLFGVQALPTTLLIPLEGQPILVTGAIPKETLLKAINEELLGEEASAAVE